MSDADKTKMDGIETGATADQSDAEIKTAYENNSDTNALTDALLTKLNFIETPLQPIRPTQKSRLPTRTTVTQCETADALQTKLNGIEASADVTDTANVTSAGALMTTGGTMSGNLTLNADFNGSGHVKSEGADGGLIMRTWTQISTYASLATNGMSGNEHIIISNGEDLH